MDFEWNERKRLTNIEKHELDFEDADIVFENPHVVAAARMVAGEERWCDRDLYAADGGHAHHLHAKGAEE
jgi:uncharacterized DUF497 family protein